MLEEMTYDQCQVIDFISEYDLTQLLENKSIDSLVTSYWNGPYETLYFMNTSLKYWVIKSFIQEQRNFGD